MALAEQGISFAGRSGNWEVRHGGVPPAGASGLDGPTEIYQIDYLVASRFGVPSAMSQEELLKLAIENASQQAGCNGVAAKFPKGVLKPTPKKSG